MARGQTKTPARGQAQPGQQNRSAEAAGTCNVANNKGQKKRGGVYYIAPHDGSEPFEIAVTTRTAWALDRLRAAGAKGITPKDTPAPRWSAYVHVLRKEGVPIETIREKHGGPFPGSHGRYVLHADVQKGGGA